MRLTLSRAVSLAVLARAKSEADHHEDLGCSILGPPSRPVRAAHAGLKRVIQRLGAEEAARQARALVRWMEASPRYAALCRGTAKRDGRRLLREDVLFPEPTRHLPRVLHLRRDELGLDVPVRPKDWPQVQELFSVLAQGATPAALRAFSRVPVTKGLVDDLRTAGWLERHEAVASREDLVFVGHNTTLVRGQRGTVLVDPYFRPASRFDLPHCQPMQPRDLGRVDAVVITHSHGDHFHLGSLLQLPRDVRVFVPPVERESLFSTDCALRLRQLGFTNVEPLAPWETRDVGDVTVQALPFFGEQPTDGPGVYPGLFNVGATWLLRTPRVSAAFFADSGHDARGDMKEVCRRVRKEGGVDVLFCGVRGFRLEPIFFGFTTLDAYLVNVPLDALTTPQQLMADGETALSYAKALGAKWLAPCADGGAPWYWREGMGPRYPGYPGEPVVGASTWDENPDADPYPERVTATRGGPQVLLLRPGAEVSWGARPRVRHRATFEWPFAVE
ncbi:MAG: MBL fold metallo-hydrolase [Myxococcota bacterium]